MDLLYCTSEAYPLIKTGGLADVCGSLPKALLQLEHNIRVVLPAYPVTLQQTPDLTTLTSLKLEGLEAPVNLLYGRLPGSEVPLYLVDAPALFNRPGNPYTQADGSDWPDNAERFALFARACVALALGQADPDFQPQVVHCNDWQTGLVPALLSRHAERPATLFSIHNLAYQGLFSAKQFASLKLPDALWSMDGVEFHNMLSFIKGGIVYADWITTVSPTYAEEICADEYGYGLAGLLRYRASRLTGILNGIDNDIWNPAGDKLLARRYDVHTLQHKLFNKFVLQRDHELSVGSQPLLLGYVGRLVEQKGVDLILDIIDDLCQHPVQLIVLGSGDPLLEQQLLDATRRHPRQVAVHIGFDEVLAHRIEAGCDAFLMPSRYEPCGLNQMYSQLYGTVPIVRRTGGLADSVVNYDQQGLDTRSATGFCFEEDSSEALLATCLGALSLYRNDRVNWWKLVISGMNSDFSWTQSAIKYSELYSHVLELRDHPADVDQASLPGGVAAHTSDADVQRLH